MSHISKIGYCRYQMTQVPENWKGPPEEISNGYAVQFDFDYKWNDTNTECTLSNLEWAPGQVIYKNGTRIFEKGTKVISEDDDGNQIITWNEETPLTFSSEEFRKSKLIINVNVNNNEIIQENGIIYEQQNLTGNFTYPVGSNLTVNFSYSYIDNNNITYSVTIPDIKILKASKYEKNVVFTYDGVNELLNQIKNYPIIDIDSIDANQQDGDNNIWSYYTNGQPCIKISYGDNDKKISYDENKTTQGYKYVPVGSNIKFLQIGDNDNYLAPLPENALENTQQSTGTFRVKINTDTFEVPIAGLAGGAGEAINFSGDLLPTEDDRYNIGSIYKWPALEYDAKYEYYEYQDGSYILATPSDLNDLFESQDGKSYDESQLPYYQKINDEEYIKVDSPNEDDIGNYYLPKYYYRSYYRWQNLYITGDIGAENSPVDNIYVKNINTAPNEALTMDGPLTITSTNDGINESEGDDGNLTAAASNGITGKITASINTLGGIYAKKNIYATRVFNAVFNDYAECRATINLTPGHVVIDQDDGSLTCSFARLQPGAQVISDTYGHLMGGTDKAKTPIAVAGRVLVYTYQSRENYHAGMAVCSAPDGTVDIMTREEIRDYPDCIIGIVSEIPQYETWGSDNVKVDGRIWIKVK